MNCTSVSKSTRLLTLSHGTESMYLFRRQSDSRWILTSFASYAPYKFNMEKFTHVGSISQDHIDPSIFCVLTAKSKTPGAPLADFLIFSGRWDVANHTFRPPVRNYAFSTVPIFITNTRLILCPCSITTATPRLNSWVSYMVSMVVARTNSCRDRARMRQASALTAYRTKSSRARLRLSLVRCACTRVLLVSVLLSRDKVCPSIDFVRSVHV